MPPLLPLRVTAILAATGVGGCALATGEIQGGELLADAGSGSTTTNDLPDAGMVTWTELYDSYFAPTAQASCTAIAGECHGAVGDLGVISSGYVCGATKDSCWAGMMASALPAYPALLPVGGSTSPTTTVLYKALHPVGVNNAGQMPQSSADGGMGYQFTPLDLARVAAWIDQGAAND
jgi:hypothetical protein